MQINKNDTLCVFSRLKAILDKTVTDQLLDILPEQYSPLELSTYLRKISTETKPYLYDIATIEAHLVLASEQKALLDCSPAQLIVNPTLALIETSWLGLAELFGPTEVNISDFSPKKGQEILVSFIHPKSQLFIVQPIKKTHLLALKIVIEDLNCREVAAAEKTTLAVLDNAIEHAVSKGLLLKPTSSIKRSTEIFADSQDINPEFITAETFTLQWHITQSCDLHCKHCYDRSSRPPVSLEDAETIMDQLYDFCHANNVHGQISFTGGNPLLHPNFFELYQGAKNRGFMTAILGNPTTPDTIEAIKAIQVPEFYQVSLEGTQTHNDYIRGGGHFNRVLSFLDALKKAGIYSMVMLTLTRDNMEQVLPLAEFLKDKVDLFTFNRLSAVGEGAQLLTPSKDQYKAFLHDFIKAEQNNPILANKDNLINLLRFEEGKELFGGCAGFGCGAAFNFVSLLPDGEVHACRKFNSPIGSIHTQTLSELYASKNAQSYRNGPKECYGCKIRHACGGCLAVIDSQGQNYTIHKDPCCFID